MRKSSVRFKIFLTTAALLTFCAFIIYLSLYMVLPQYYYKYKKNSTSVSVNKLIEECKNESISNGFLAIDKFVRENNVHAKISYSNGVIWWSFPAFYKDNNNITPPEKNEVENENITPPEKDEVGNENIISDNNTDKNSIDSTKDNIIKDDEKNNLKVPLGDKRKSGEELIRVTGNISFSDSDEVYILEVNTPLQPIDEASTVMAYLMPYMMVIIIIVSLIAAYLYSKSIVSPLIKINKTAKEMSKLDFSVKCNVKSNDEMGELATSLNELSANLKETMDSLHNANEKLKMDIQRQKEQEEERREFVATISHELKSPITAVSGQIEGMLYNIGAYKDREKYLRKSLYIMKDMEKLVYELLDVYRLDNKKALKIKVKINLFDLIDKIVADVMYFIEEKKLKLTVDVRKEYYIEGNLDMIKKAFSNIIINGIKYSEENGELIIKLEGNNFQVINTGAYIDKADLDKIFEPFYRVEKSRNRKTGGSGLGLHIVKKVLEVHDYKYTIENIENAVKFTIELVSVDSE
ncbi:Sensor histidine kinase [Clostridium bornimense]|uniref:histidine kinase n=1 Tax=Clostridium bornimense TaxID=1216932 RepID=W6S020_9CLOT|nr:HAMP domain-containing sensor histidine kinase [Clostridium bornimense]CDM67617.1 Sensor histidine kinase [Clostridium bornimense]